MPHYRPFAEPGATCPEERHEPTSTYPYLQLDAFVVSKHRLHLEVNADRGHKSRREGVICVPEEKRCFAHAAVADYQQLEHVVEVLVRGVLLPLRVLSSCHLWDIKRGAGGENLELLKYNSS
jgi:hypothetical protein